MQRCEDNLQCGLARKFGMRIDRNAPAVVSDGQAIANFQRDFDTAGMPRDRFVHAIVEHFGSQMVQRPLVRPADIHARTATRSEEQTSELQSLMRISYAVFCLK